MKILLRSISLRGADMKVAILNGLEETNGIYQSVTDQLAGRGSKINSFPLMKMEVAGCRGCFGCWIKTPGICVINDLGRKVAEAVIGSDVTIILSPVTFGGYSYHVKKVMDRLIPLISPLFVNIRGEIHHKPRYQKYPRLLAIGVASVEDIESQKVFSTLIERNAINFHAPAWDGTVLRHNMSSQQINNSIGKLFSGLEVAK